MQGGQLAKGAMASAGPSPGRKPPLHLSPGSQAVSWSHRALCILWRLLSQKHDGPHWKWSFQAAPIWQEWQRDGPGRAPGLTEDVGHQDSVHPLVIFQKLCRMKCPVQGLLLGDFPVLLHWPHTNTQISLGVCFWAGPWSCLYCLSSPWINKASSHGFLLQNKGHSTGLQIRAQLGPELEGQQGAAKLTPPKSTPG